MTKVMTSPKLAAIGMPKIIKEMKYKLRTTGKMLKIKPIFSGFKLKFFDTINKRITNDPINLKKDYLKQK